MLAELGQLRPLEQLQAQLCAREGEQAAQQA
jgi:hypothetical protein